ncbi:MAG: DUF2764 family protein [Candidatus Omnitrophota bacterium]
MKNKYFYLVASLPYLRFTKEMSFSVEDFIHECEKWLTPPDMKALLSADIHDPERAGEDFELFRVWKEFDSRLKKELAGIREASRKGESYKTPDVLQETMARENPLLMEESLEKTRWDFLEERAFRYNFDLNRLVLYFLKLQILERMSRFNKDAGESFFHSLCEVRYE